MKSGRNPKTGSKEWSQRANNVVDRVDSIASDSTAVKMAKSQKSAHTHELAHEEWVKWAQVIVDRLTAIVPDYVPPPMPLRSGDAGQLQKPSRGEWTRWAEVVIDRLTTCVHVYSKPPYTDVFMPDKERLEKNARTVDLLRRIHALTDDAGAPTDSLTDLGHHNERVMAGLKVLMKETLARLPELSSDMQLLLKSPWVENCNGRLASELFIGPEGREKEGIGSGHAVHGRLPETLQNLMEREETGHERQIVESDNEEHAHNPRWHDDAPKRWSRNNAQSLRTAGRVE